MQKITFVILALVSLSNISYASIVNYEDEYIKFSCDENNITGAFFDPGNKYILYEADNNKITIQLNETSYFISINASNTFTIKDFGTIINSIEIK